jgi:hypothetical protein
MVAWTDGLDQQSGDEFQPEVFRKGRHVYDVREPDPEACPATEFQRQTHTLPFDVLTTSPCFEEDFRIQYLCYKQHNRHKINTLNLFLMQPKPVDDTRI